MAIQSHLNKSRLDKFVLAFNLPEALKEARRKSPAPAVDDLDFEQQSQELEARLYAALAEATEVVSQK